MNPTSNQSNSGIAGQDANGVSINVPYTGAQLPSAMASTNPVANTSPTTVSNANKVSQVQTMQSQVSNLSQNRGQTSDGTTVKNADGSIVQDSYTEPTLPQGSTPIYGSVNGQGNRIVGYNTPDMASGMQTPTYFDSNTSTPAETPEDKQFNDTLASMKASTDATTARTISSIQQKYAQLKTQQDQINQTQQAGTQNALLMGGITGQGSSSQYAPISSTNIVAAQMNYGVQKLAELDSQEQDLINSAQAAGDSKDYQLMEKQLARADEIRKEKNGQTQKLNDAITKQNATARETLIQSTRDNALADLYSQGITSPTELLKNLNGNGGDFTLKEINDGLKNIATNIGTETKGMTSDAREFFALRDKGEIPQSILALPTVSEQLNAYLRNKAVARKVPTATKTIVSGGLTYTPQDQGEDSKILEASRGGDGYVDPTKYESLYKAWVGHHGLLKDFLTKFPPKNYVNPANDWLPFFLRPATKSGGAKATIDQL